MSDLLMQLWYLMHCLAMMAQASLRKSAYSPKSSLLVNTKYVNTVEPVYNGHSKLDKTKIKSISECSPWCILYYFWPI